MKLLAMIIVTLLLATATSACQQQRPLGPLRVGLLVWPSYEIPYLARKLGYYDDQSLQLIDYSTPAEVVRDYRNGSIDVIAVTLDYLLQLSDTDPVHRAILIINYSQGGDAIIAKPDIQSMQDLVGRRVGVERSPLGAYVLTRALEQSSMSIDDILIHSVDTADQAQAYKRGDVDAVVTYEPVRTHLLDTGGRELFNSAEIPGEIVDVLVASNTTIATRKLQLVNFVNGWMRALDYLRTHPEDAAAQVAARERLSPSQYLDALQGMMLLNRQENNAAMHDRSSGLSMSLKRLQDVAIREGFIQHKHPIQDMMDSSILNSVAQ